MEDSHVKCDDCDLGGFANRSALQTHRQLVHQTTLRTTYCQEGTQVEVARSEETGLFHCDRCTSSSHPYATQAAGCFHKHARSCTGAAPPSSTLLPVAGVVDTSALAAMGLLWLEAWRALICLPCGSAITFGALGRHWASSRMHAEDAFSSEDAKTALAGHVPVAVSELATPDAHAHCIQGLPLDKGFACTECTYCASNIATIDAHFSAAHGTVRAPAATSAAAMLQRWYPSATWFQVERVPTPTPALASVPLAQQGAPLAQTYANLLTRQQILSPLVGKASRTHPHWSGRITNFTTILQDANRDTLRTLAATKPRVSFKSTLTSAVLALLIAGGAMLSEVPSSILARLGTLNETTSTFHLPTAATLATYAATMARLLLFCTRAVLECPLAEESAREQGVLAIWLSLQAFSAEQRKALLDLTSPVQTIVQAAVLVVVEALLQQPLLDAGQSCFLLVAWAALCIGADDGWAGPEVVGPMISHLFCCARLLTLVRQMSVHQLFSSETLLPLARNAEARQRCWGGFPAIIAALLSRESLNSVPFLAQVRGWAKAYVASLASQNVFDFGPDGLRWKGILFKNAHLHGYAKFVVDGVQEQLDALLDWNSNLPRARLHIDTDALVDSTEDGSIGTSLITQNLGVAAAAAPYWLVVAATLHLATDEKTFDRSAASAYLAAELKLLRLLFAAIFTVAAQPRRGTEAVSVLLHNTAEHQRTVHLGASGAVYVGVSHSKTSWLASAPSYPPRFLPAPVARALLLYLFCIRPLADLIREQLHDASVASAHLFVLADGRTWPSAFAAQVLKDLSILGGLPMALTVAGFRQVLAACSRRWIPEHSHDEQSDEEDVGDGHEDEHGTMLDTAAAAVHLQAGHSLRTAWLHYGVPSASRSLTLGELAVARVASHVFQIVIMGLSLLQAVSKGDIEKPAFSIRALISEASATPTSAQPPRPPPPVAVRCDVLVRPATIIAAVRATAGVDEEASIRWKSAEQRLAVLAAGSHPVLLAILGTAGGKTLIYLPYARLSPLLATIVVIPYVPLKEEHARRCKVAGVSAIIWNGESADEIGLLVDVVIVSLDQAVGEAFLTMARRLRVLGRLERVVFDEVHVVLFEAHFRPVMADAWKLCSLAPHTLLLTATCPVEVQNHMLRSVLRIEGPVKVVRGSTQRKNLAFRVLDHPSLAASHQQLVRRVSEQLVTSTGRVLIICSTKGDGPDGAASIAALLDTRPVLSGTDDQQRLASNDAFVAFVNGQSRVLVGTSCVGTGIDLPDIRLVVYLGTPYSITAFHQVAGRAGRDGQRAEVWLWWSSAMPRPEQDSFQANLLTELLTGQCCRRSPISASADVARVDCAHIHGARCDRCLDVDEDSLAQSKDGVTGALPSPDSSGSSRGGKGPSASPGPSSTPQHDQHSKTGATKRAFEDADQPTGSSTNGFKRTATWTSSSTLSTLPPTQRPSPLTPISLLDKTLPPEKIHALLVDLLHKQHGNCVECRLRGIGKLPHWPREPDRCARGGDTGAAWSVSSWAQLFDWLTGSCHYGSGMPYAVYNACEVLTAKPKPHQRSDEVQPLPFTDVARVVLRLFTRHPELVAHAYEAAEELFGPFAVLPPRNVVLTPNRKLPKAWLQVVPGYRGKQYIAFSLVTAVLLKPMPSSSAATA